MVIFVLGIIGFSWYAVVPACYGKTLRSGPPGAAFGAFLACALISALAAMTAWAYFATALTDPGRVPEGWTPFGDDEDGGGEAARRALDRFAVGLEVSGGGGGGSGGGGGGSYGGGGGSYGGSIGGAAFSGGGGAGGCDPRRPRFCRKCRAWKPERAHHCGVMGRCVLKMDHYCVWVRAPAGHGRWPAGWLLASVALRSPRQFAAPGAAQTTKTTPSSPRIKNSRHQNTHTLTKQNINKQVVNCVGLLNYKFFLQFLGYALLACAAAVALLIKPMAGFFGGHPEADGCAAFVLRGRGALVAARGGGAEGRATQRWSCNCCLPGDPASPSSSLQTLRKQQPPTTTSSAPAAFVAVVIDGALLCALLGFLGMHASLIAHGCTTIGARARGSWQRARGRDGRDGRGGGRL